MPDKSFTLVVYDIPDDKRRAKLHKRLLDFGTPVQYSVFECEVDAQGLAKMQKAVLRIVSKRKDDVRMYRLCGTCRGKTWSSRGEAPAKEAPALVV